MVNVKFSLIIFIQEIRVIKEWRSCSAASDYGLHCCHLSLKRLPKR